MNKLMLTGAFALAMVATSASAVVTVSTQAGAPDPGIPAGFSMIWDFDALTPTTELTGNFAILTTPSGTGQSAPPAGSAPGNNYLSVPMPSDVPGGNVGSAVLTLGGKYKKISFYWGSIDQYNTVDILDIDGNILGSFTGGTLPAPTGNFGNQADALSNRRVTFVSSSASNDIAGLGFSSDGFAFELDSVAGAVPEPATWAMMIGGFGLIGFAARRKGAARSVLA